MSANAERLAVVTNAIAFMLYGVPDIEQVKFSPADRRRCRETARHVLDQLAEYDGDPPAVPLKADPKLVTHLIMSSTPVPPPLPEPKNFGGGIESVQEIGTPISEQWSKCPKCHELHAPEYRFCDGLRPPKIDGGTLEMEPRRVEDSTDFMRRTLLQVLGRIEIMDEAIHQLRLNVEADREWAADLQKELVVRQGGQ